jgi:hypothetical protein
MQYNEIKMHSKNIAIKICTKNTALNAKRDKAIKETVQKQGLVSI